MKETGWLTNSWHLAQLLEGESANHTAGRELHRHVHLVNGTAKLSAAYPPKLVKAILKALKLEMRDCGELSTEEEKVAGPTCVESLIEQFDCELGDFLDDVNGGWLD